MICWHCDRPAHATCVYCGRAVCRDHAQSLPNLLALYEGNDRIQRALVVGNAVACGVCSPSEEPVRMDDLV